MWKHVKLSFSQRKITDYLWNNECDFDGDITDKILQNEFQNSNEELNMCQSVNVNDDNEIHESIAIINPQNV